MSRSKHTDPRRIRAARRVRAPDEPRGHADLSSQRVLARTLKESGIALNLAFMPDRDERPAALPRVIVKRPRKGHIHPASPAEIREVLRFFGEECTYGVQTVELLQSKLRLRAHEARFGTLLVPGRIVLYEQPSSPWLLPGRLPAKELHKLRRAGAIVESISEPGQTIVSWPTDTLRDFMLFDVLMHEIGHHLLQQYKGKRRARVARTADHETLAERFAARCRLLFRNGRSATR